MTNDNISNDTRILELKKKIEEKKEKVGKTVKFSPVTNCSLELHGIRYNIHAMTKEQLISVMSMLQSYAMASKTLNVNEAFTIGGYHVSDWIEDLKSKYEFVSRTDELKSLKVMEEKLVKLLSEGKKVELELDDIASLLE